MFSNHLPGRGCFPKTKKMWVCVEATLLGVPRKVPDVLFGVHCDSVLNFHYSLRVWELRCGLSLQLSDSGWRVRSSKRRLRTMFARHVRARPRWKAAPGSCVA